MLDTPVKNPVPARSVSVTGEDWVATAKACSVSADADIQEFIRANPGCTDDFQVPRRVTIETIFGCNAKCTMCVIDHPTSRPKRVMDMELFTRIIDRLVPYQGKIQMMDFFALGEPLIDPLLFDRIRYAKSKGFRRLAFATNGHLLTPEKQKGLLESGIDTVIFSLDGITKETHEAIRIRVDYQRTVQNIESVIRLRDGGNYKTRFIVRFVRQDANRHEWPAYRAYWSSRLSPDKNDLVTCYDMHTWGGQLAEKDEILAAADRDPLIERAPCHHVFEKLTVLADGSIPLCSEDILDPAYGFGKVGLDDDPIQMFNSPHMRAMRQLHLAGKKTVLKGCAECTLLYSEPKRGTD